MKPMWIIVIAAIALSTSYVAGNDCNETRANHCFKEVTNYEGPKFPLYGQDEHELDETCKNINVSYECLLNYVEACDEMPKCNEKCQSMIHDIGVFSTNTGLFNLQTELCDKHGDMRKNYLENYVCLGDNAGKYASCHDYSIKSQTYMRTIPGKKEAVEAQCCYFSWFHNCFKTATETCRDGAMQYVTFGLHILTGHVQELLCKNNPVQCEKPPLPAKNGDEDEPNLPEDEDTSKKPNKQIGKPTKVPSKNASNRLTSTCHVVIFIIAMLFSNHLFSIN